MTTYAQTTIHSKVAKFQRTDGNALGKVIRGTNTQFGKLNKSTSYENQPSFIKQIQILPKTRTNISRKIKNKVIPSLRKKDQIVLMESTVFPAIYFKKTTMRNILKQFNFPNNVKALPPNDDRTPLIFQIVSNLFNQISFYIFNILIGQNTLTNSFYVFFSDSQTIPFTKCCNAPVYMQLMDNGSGKILCNSVKCPHTNLAEFLINFQDGKKLWKNITYFSQASQKDRQLRLKISKYIHNGKFRRMSLVNVVQDTSKQIVDIFYSTKQKKIQNVQNQQVDNQFSEAPFLTAQKNVVTVKNSSQQQIFEGQTQPQITIQDIVSPQQKNIQLLKMKIQYMAQANGKQVSKNVTKQLINQGKVFHKNFQMIRKIDQFMIGQKKSKNNTRISFPKIIDQMKKDKIRINKSQSVYNTFS